MKRFAWGLALVFGGAVLLPLALVPAQTKEEPKKEIKKKEAKKTKDDALFGLTKLHKFHLKFSAEEWAKMQPAQGFGFGPPGFPPEDPKKDVEKKPADKQDEKPADVHRGGGFGTEFPWAKADFSADGKTFANVGVRYKGNFTYMASAQMLRRPLKIELDHYNAKHNFYKQDKLNLSNGVTDAARAREALAFAVYRAAGVPASRTAYAELTLTVAGKYENEHVGLYTLIEQVDKNFLKTHFKSSKGLLLKPENLRGGIEYLGEEWKRYEDKYRPKSESTKKQQERLIAFARLVGKADDAEFQKEIASYLDVDAFVRFMAADTLLANLDSLLGFGHNFYMYLRPDNNKFVFIPWDLDLSMGMWPPGGQPQQQIDLSLEHPHMGQNKLIDRLLGMKDVKEKYFKTLRELSSTCFTKEKLLKDLDAIEPAIKDALAREKKAGAERKEGLKGPGMAGMIGQGMPVRAFVEKRTESVVAQLAGERKGYVPKSFSFGPPGGFKGPPGGFGIGNALAKPLLAALDANKDDKLSKEEASAGARQFFKEAAKDEKGTLDEAALAGAINRMMPRPPGFPPPPAGAFGPGNFLAGSILKRARVDKEGKLTLEKFVAAAEALYQEADREKKGQLDEAGIAAGLNLLMPRFGQGFGPPAGKKE